MIVITAFCCNSFCWIHCSFCHSVNLMTLTSLTLTEKIINISANLLFILLIDICSMHPFVQLNFLYIVLYLLIFYLFILLTELSSLFGGRDSFLLWIFEVQLPVNLPHCAFNSCGSWWWNKSPLSFCRMNNVLILIDEES